jgi:hypothetical protein
LKNKRFVLKSNSKKQAVRLEMANSGTIRPMSSPTNLFATVPKRSARAAVAPFLPMSRAEMDALGWDQCDVILVTGDAYIDHPSFGMALVGRLLEAQGYRVGIISQPDWLSADAFRASASRACTTASPPAIWIPWSTVHGRPQDPLRRRLHGQRGTEQAPGPRRHRVRPARREAYPDVPIVIGSIEASCAASPITTTGRTRCAVPCCPIPRPTC